MRAIKVSVEGSTKTHCNTCGWIRAGRPYVEGGRDTSDFCAIFGDGLKNQPWHFRLPKCKAAEAKLAQVFREYGELKQANKLARRIATIRRTQKIESTTQLRRIVEDVCRWIPQKGKVHPAAKVFQALRIEVNQELQGLGEFLERLIRLISPGARFQRA